MTVTKKIIFIFIMMFNASADQRDIDTYFKCYRLMTEMFIPDQDDPRMIAIQQGDLSGTDACIELLKLAEISNSSPMLDHEDQLAVKIFNTFHIFHSSFLKNYGLGVGKTPRQKAQSHLVFDDNEASYFFTRTLFNKDVEFKSIVTDNKTIEAVRLSEYQEDRVAHNLIYGGHANFPRGFGYTYYDSNNNRIYLAENRVPIPLAQAGQLIGFKYKEPFIWNLLPVNQSSGLYQKVKDDGVNFFESLGGGMIGGANYYLSSRPFNWGSKYNGGTYIPRKWSRGVINDLLCRQIPIIRPIDALPFVNQKGDAELAYKNGVSCMTCHASMDPIAFTQRNRTVIKTLKTDLKPNTTLAVTYPIDPEIESSPNVPDKNMGDFHKQLPLGRLYFRDIDGSLFNQAVSNTAELGLAFSKTKGLYACAANRYLKFFTNIEAPLLDPGDINSPAFHPSIQEHINFVKSLGSELKEHQDLTKTIRKIIDSSFFLNPTKSLEEQ